MRHIRLTQKYILLLLLGLSLGTSIAFLVCKYGNASMKIVSRYCSSNILKKCTRPDYTGADYDGIDVSNHQGIISWSKVAKDKNIHFVYIKATEGATYQDRRYYENVKGAKDNGFLVGSYHYLRNTSSIRKQFINFKNTAKKINQDLIPIVDVEEKVEKDSILLFCNLLKKHYGEWPIIYGTNKSYNMYCAPDFNNYYLMIGRYGDNPPEIKGKGQYSIWQFSEKGRINGIPKPVDLDRFHPNFNLSDLLLKK